MSRLSDMQNTITSPIYSFLSLSLSSQFGNHFKPLFLSLLCFPDRCAGLADNYYTCICQRRVPPVIGPPVNPPPMTAECALVRGATRESRLPAPKPWTPPNYGDEDRCAGVLRALFLWVTHCWRPPTGRELKKKKIKGDTRREGKRGKRRKGLREDREEKWRTGKGREGKERAEKKGESKLRKERETMEREEKTSESDGQKNKIKNKNGG